MKGFSDTDLIEIYESSIEVMSLNEEMGKKVTFGEVVRRELFNFDYKKKKEKGTGMYQEACCGGPLDSPETIVRGLVPRLNETLFEILQEAPFKGEVALTSGSEPMYIKQEAIVTSITAFTLRLMEQKVVNRRKITFTGEVSGVSATEAIRIGDLLTVNMKIEKLQHMKVPESKRKVYAALVNQTTNQIMISEIEPSLKNDTRKFQTQMRQKDKNKFVAYVFGADGQIESSFPTDFVVKEKAN